jgi:branched-chain amino acid transport system substrate-binding protein
MVSGSSNPNVTKIGNYVFRVCFIDSFQGTVMAKFALNSLKKTRVAVLTDVRQDYSVGLAQFFKEYFTKNGGTVVAQQSYSSGDQDFKVQLASIKAANPEAIFVPGYYNEVGLIALQAHELGITVPLMGGDGWDSPMLTQIGGVALEGSFFTNQFRISFANSKSASAAIQTEWPRSGTTRPRCCSMRWSAPAARNPRRCATPWPRPRISKA